MADTNAEKFGRRLVGLGVSRGVGRGRVVFLRQGNRPLIRSVVPESGVQDEILRFRTAVEAAKLQLRDLSKSPANNEEHPVSDIFGVHLLILESSLIEKTESAIREKRINAEWALRDLVAEYSDRQASLADEHFRDKYLDIEDVANRLTRAMRGGTSSVDLEPHSVVVARELRPSAVIELAKHHPAGVITETGGWTSHMSIIAREFHLPMVTGIKNAEKLLSSGDLVVVDGNAGEVLLDQDPTKGKAVGRILARGNSAGENESPPHLFTTDGVEVIIRANAEDPLVYDRAKELGARGIGLFRSESLVGENGILPSEDEQFDAYIAVAKAVGGDAVAIRTFDISAVHLSGNIDDCEANPALGLRAIRAGLTDPEMLRTQLRAILRASTAGKVDIILPMISNVEEIIQARILIGTVREELLDQGVRAGDPRVGIMVEVPSAVIAAAQMVRHADFICLGTNDLVQYLLAVDRDNDAVANWYQTLHPAVLLSIKSVIDSAMDGGIPTTVCGEMAGSPFYVPVLVGLGAREISIHNNSIKSVANLITGISSADANALVKTLSNCETARETEARLREYYLANWKDLFPPGIINSRHR